MTQKKLSKITLEHVFNALADYAADCYPVDLQYTSENDGEQQSLTINFNQSRFDAGRKNMLYEYDLWLSTMTNQDDGLFHLKEGAPFLKGIGVIALMLSSIIPYAALRTLYWKDKNSYLLLKYNKNPDGLENLTLESCKNKNEALFQRMYALIDDFDVLNNTTLSLPKNATAAQLNEELFKLFSMAETTFKLNDTKTFIDIIKYNIEVNFDRITALNEKKLFSQMREKLRQEMLEQRRLEEQALEQQRLAKEQEIEKQHLLEKQQQEDQARDDLKKYVADTDFGGTHDDTSADDILDLNKKPDYDQLFRPLDNDELKY